MERSRFPAPGEVWSSRPRSPPPRHPARADGASPAASTVSSTTVAASTHIDGKVDVVPEDWNNIDLKVNKKFKIIATVAGGGKVDVSQTAVASSLQAHPKVTAFVNLSDESAVGTVQALKAAGKKQSSTCVTSVGGSDQAVSLYNSRAIYAIAKIDFEGDLKQNIDWLVKAMKNPTGTPGTLLYTPVKEFAGK